MIPDLSAEDATVLASKYDFSGGQIENIARKSVVDKILTGDDLSVATLMEHCNAESIESNNRQRIGY
jgi:hypothetical protein